MIRGKKRGSSSGTDGSGRGGKKREVVAGSSGSASSRSSGKDRAKVDSETKKMEKALENAYKLSNACKQYTLAEVDKATWRLTTDGEGVIRSSYADFKAVLDERRNFFKKVMSLLIHGIPVTQPDTNETYHIVNIEVDGVVVLQLLFRQSDGYLLAFRRVSTVGNPVWEGWYYFKDKDLILPSFCEEQVKLDIDSGYDDFYRIRFGRDMVSTVVNCLLAFTKENCASRDYGEHNRSRLLQTLMVFFGECQRSGMFLEFPEMHFESVTLVRVTGELSDHRHSWINVSRVLMALYLAFLWRKYRFNKWEAKVEKAESALTLEFKGFTDLGYNGIKRFIVYEMVNDKRVPNYTLSMQNFLGSDVGQLLHLIKYDKLYVQEIHLARMKAGLPWPVSEADD